jgi:hypothetical protein
MEQQAMKIVYTKMLEAGYPANPVENSDSREHIERVAQAGLYEAAALH